MAHAAIFLSRIIAVRFRETASCSLKVSLVSTGMTASLPRVRNVAGTGSPTGSGTDPQPLFLRPQWPMIAPARRPHQTSAASVPVDVGPSLI